MLNKFYFFIRVFKISPAIAFRKIIDNLLSTLNKNRQRLLDLENSSYKLFQKENGINKKSNLLKLIYNFPNSLHSQKFDQLLKNTNTKFSINHTFFKDNFNFADNELIDSDLQEKIINIANKVTLHQFNLLGSNWIKVEPQKFDSWNFWIQKNVNTININQSIKISKYISENYTPIDWQLDFKSGFRWDSTEWSFDIKYGNIKGADIKVPWELGRMQHLLWLALAYSLTHKKYSDSESENDEQNPYLTEYKNEILDFIASNPPRFGVQWICSMDIGIRAVNWLISYDIFKSSGAKFDDAFEEIFIYSIIQHTNHLTQNLEWASGMRGNHYFTNITSLLIISSYLNTNDITNSWLAFAIQELISETESQFLNDGGNFEKSIPYHFYVVEVLLTALTYLSSLNIEKIKSLQSVKFFDIIHGKKILPLDKQKFSIENDKILFPKTFLERFSSIIEFTISIVNDFANSVQIGDNDSGQFCKWLPDYESTDDLSQNSSKIISLLSYIFKNDFRSIKLSEKQMRINHYYQNILFFFNIENLTNQFPNDFIEEKLFDTQLNDNSNLTKSFPDFGILINKTKNYFSLIKCGSLGQNGKGGHSHNDNLSLCLFVANTPLLVDPGTYNYTAFPEKRNLYRSTSMHNTLELNGFEQNGWLTNSKDDLFWFHKIKSKGRVLEFSEKIFVGEHYGFTKPHKRIISFESSTVLGVDLCEAKGIKRIHFHLAPGIRIDSLTNNLVALLSKDFSINFSFDNDEVKIVDYLYSPGYGKTIPAKKIILTTEKNKINWKIEII